MASWPRLGSMESPRTEIAIERTHAGFAAALRRMSTAELMAQATAGAAALEEENRRLLGSELLSAYLSRNLDSPVLRSTSSDVRPPDRPRAPDARPSPSPLPGRSSRRSTSAPQGRGIVAKLVRSGMAADARRARAEGRR